MQMFGLNKLLGQRQNFPNTETECNYKVIISNKEKKRNTKLKSIDK